VGTFNLGCRYTDNDNKELIGFSDSNISGDVDDQKSTFGVLFTLGGYPVT
jgi:hypothetical protein